MKTSLLFLAGIFGLILATPSTAQAYHHRGYGDPYYRHQTGVSIGISRGHSSYHSSHHSLAAEVQSALAHRGYFHGDVDGTIGPRSSRAIAHYQHDHRLPVTGTIDRYLLRSLGL